MIVRAECGTALWKVPLTSCFPKPLTRRRLACAVSPRPTSHPNLYAAIAIGHLPDPLAPPEPTESFYP
eukprot:1504739-Pleurochrysis_carterae.AAC.1